MYNNKVSNTKYILNYNFLIYLISGFDPFLEFNHEQYGYTCPLLPEQQHSGAVQLREQDLRNVALAQMRTSPSSFAESGTDIRIHQYHPSFSRPKPFKCYKCNRSYVRKDHLKRHLIVECGVPPQLSCDFCNYKTKHKHVLKNHLSSQHKNRF